MDASVVRMHLHHMPYFILKKFHFSTLNFQESPLLILNISFGTKWTLNFADPFKRQGLLIFFVDGNQVEKKSLVLSLEKMDFIFAMVGVVRLLFVEGLGLSHPGFQAGSGLFRVFPKRSENLAFERVCKP
jgi:hypothetical protein